MAVPALKVTIVTRAESEATFPPDVTLVKTPYTEADLTEAFKGQDAVISIVGANGLAYQKVFVDAAINAGVRRFMPSEFSVNTLSNAVRELLPLFDAKLELLDYLKGKENAGLTWTALATGPLFDWVRILNRSTL